MTERGREKTPEERAAIIVWHLAHGDAIKDAEAGRLMGMTRQGANRLLCGVSRVIPIYKNDYGYWVVLAMQEAE